MVSNIILRNYSYTLKTKSFTHYQVIPFKSPLAKGDSGGCVFSGLFYNPLCPPLLRGIWGLFPFLRGILYAIHRITRINKMKSYTLNNAHPIPTLSLCIVQRLVCPADQVFQIFYVRARIAGKTDTDGKLFYPVIKPRILYYDVRLFYNSLEKIYFFAVNSFGGAACQYNQSAQLIDESYWHVKICDFLFTFNPRLFYPVFPKNLHFV